MTQLITRPSLIETAVTVFFCFFFLLCVDQIDEIMANAKLSRMLCDTMGYGQITENAFELPFV